MSGPMRTPGRDNVLYCVGLKSDATRSVNSRRQWRSRSQPVATMLLAAALSVTPGVGMRAQRASNRKPPPPAAPLALEIADFASLPITGRPDGTGNNAGSLARLNVMRQEPGPAGRFFVNDLTGPLYILDPRTKSATTYVDFNGRGALHRPVRQTARRTPVWPAASSASSWIRTIAATAASTPSISRRRRCPGRPHRTTRAFAASMSPATRPPRRSRRRARSTTKAC